MLRSDIDDFPYDRNDKGIWYLVITHTKKDGINLKAFSAAKKHLLRRHVKTLQAKGVEFRVLGSWHGQWRTDLFVLDEIILERIG